MSRSLTFLLTVQGVFSLHRSWQKFDELQHEWHNKAEELAEKVNLLEAEAASAKTALEENEKYKEEAESSKAATSKAIKEAKQIKEELRTCQLDREYHRGVATEKTTLADDLQKDLQAQMDKCSELTAKDAEKTKLIEEQVEEILDYKDSVDICFYMFWKHNRGADFSYLGDAYAAEEAKCLKRLPEEEAEAAARRPEDPQDPAA